MSGVKPVYPEASNESVKETTSPVVVARKSAAVPLNKAHQAQQAQQPPQAPIDPNSENIDNAQVKTEDLIGVLANEAISQLSKQIKLPAGKFCFCLLAFAPPSAAGCPRVAKFWTSFEFQGAHPTKCSYMVGGYLVQI